ncbi:hypothetical protein OF83DRAFT_1173076 [Amylostereum chailletii]|nr:hypothetical protein OF83DRAFT_1173076 [Amylostereum chailletii]
MPPSAARTHFLQFAIQWSSIALLYYDYLLTFPSEVKYIWQGKILKLSTLLYILCRYALLANVLYLLAISDKLGGGTSLWNLTGPCCSCDVWYKIIGVVSVLGRAAVIFTFMARTFTFQVSDVKVLQASKLVPNTLLSILVCVFEASATILTLLRSIQALRFGGGAVNVKKHTFSYLVVEQGILYFAIVSIFTIGAAVLNFRAPGGFFQRLLNAITLPLSGMLTARFILRLRAYSARQETNKDTQELSSFQANSSPRQALSLEPIVDEFGYDPVERAARQQTLAEPGPSQTQMLFVEGSSNVGNNGTNEFAVGSSTGTLLDGSSRHS